MSHELRKAGTRARWDWNESPSPSRFLIEQDLFGKPLHTFPDHALTQGDEFEGVGLALDVAGIVVPTNYQDGPVGKAREQRAPGFGRLRLVAVGGRGPAQMLHLAGVMGDIAGNTAAWLDKKLLDIPVAQIQQAVLTQPDGTIVTQSYQNSKATGRAFPVTLQ